MNANHALLVVAALVVLLLVFLAAGLNAAYRAVFKPSQYDARLERKDATPIELTSSQGDTVHAWHYVHGATEGRGRAKTSSSSTAVSDRPCILACNTNTGNISCRSDLVDLCKSLGVDCVLFDYAGYGRSMCTKLSLQGLLGSGECAFRHVCSMYGGSQNVILLGQSIGGAVATYLASRFGCRHLLVFSSFSRLRAVVEHKSSSGVASMVEAMLGDLPSVEWAPQVRCPVTQLHSPVDGLIPFHDARLLFSSFTSSGDKKLISIGGTHSRPVVSPSSFGLVARRVGLTVVDRALLERTLESLVRVVDGCHSSR
jgi:hypothetical protein